MLRGSAGSCRKSRASAGAPLVDAKEKEISRLSGLYRLNLERAGVAIVETRAVLEDRHSVRLADGRVVSARHILVATGARPVLEPAIPGRELAITSNEVFDLEKFPERMVIVGGGYIAVEFASVFARLGTKVTQVMRGRERAARLRRRHARGRARRAGEGRREAPLRNAADADREGGRRPAGRPFQRRRQSPATR